MFSEGIEHAVRITLEAHSGQTRKGQPDLPYVSHPLHVGLILARLQADEEVVQAALLHDVVEDCEGWDLPRIENLFGVRVAGIVAELTEEQGKSWEERKSAAAQHAAGDISPEAAMIKAADKLHNLSSLVASIRAAEHRDEVWRHFSRGPEQTLEQAERLVSALTPKVPAQLGEALRATLTELRAL